VGSSSPPALVTNRAANFADLSHRRLRVPYQPQTRTSFIAPPMTRREALARERGNTSPAPAPTQPSRPRQIPRLSESVVVSPVPNRGPSARHHRSAALPSLIAAAAALLFFTSNVTPATANDLAGPVAPSSPSAPLDGQSFTASVAAVTIGDRDSYSITKPVPPPVTATSTTTQGVTAAGAAGKVVNAGTGDIRWPFPGVTPLSSDFGPRVAPCSACSSFHEGIDMIPGKGTPIGAIAAGRVRVSGMDYNYGQYVVIDHVIDGRTVSSLSGHMIVGSTPLRVGDTVAVGDFVGSVGNSGTSTGAHLHLSILLDGTLSIDPQAWLTTNAGRTL
jgi:murein DD-endopeptidase MepM/ murein hydrolase activator NlpD